MKRLFFGTALAALLLLAATAVAGTLGMATARREAKLAAFEFGSRHHLDETNVARCHRASSKTVTCAASAKGESSTATKACELTVVVRAIDHRFYTESSAAITHHRCTTAPKERLTAAAASAAIKAKADEYAGAPTELSSLFREDELTYRATARWERPAAHPSEFLPTESCSVQLVARLADGQISVETEGFDCY
jgi:hypothetical protein